MESSSDELKCVVNTKDGPVCGYINKKNEKAYYTFKGIPYAQPPIGCLRFKPPLPVRPWTDTLNCTQDAPAPLHHFKEDIVGSEDCLYLDVISPNIKTNKPLPVMFWIGSYSFSVIVDNLFDPSLIVDEEVVFVRCGFRLGCFGFLSINDFCAPGNCGLKDIILALRWVNQNISKFGGDANNVTIFGSSTGGTAVHLLMLSPMASGLFHKAIIQSVSALNYWSIVKNPIQPVIELASKLGIKSTCAADIVEELRITPAKNIVEVIVSIEQKSFLDNETYFIDPLFKPCIEEDFEGQQAFLTKSPALILKSGNFNKVPFIIGCNNIEASLLNFIKKDFYKDFEKYNARPDLIVPKSLSVDPNTSKRIGEQLLKFYLDGEVTLRNDTRTQYLQLISDYYFIYYIYKTVQLHNQYAPECPIYYYILNHGGQWNLPEDMKVFNSIGHCAEIPFIFGLKSPSSASIFKGSRDSVRTRRRVVKLWTNFAKYSDPTPNEEDALLQIKWDPVENKDKLNYLCIGSEITKGRNPFLERMEFWDELHKEHKFLRVLILMNELGILI